MSPFGRLLGTDHPFFRPLWRRVVTLALCLAWALAEFAWGETGWGIAVLIVSALAAWGFFVDFPSDDTPAGKR